MELVSESDAPGFRDVLEELIAGHLDTYGGYEHDWGVFGNQVVIASLDDSKERKEQINGP